MASQRLFRKVELTALKNATTQLLMLIVNPIDNIAIIGTIPVAGRMCWHYYVHKNEIKLFS